MKRSNPKLPFDPGFSVARKILLLIVLGCFLVFFGLIHAGEAFDPNNPVGEHPWDELKSGANHQPPRHANEMIILPCGHFGGWIIIHSPQVKDGDTQKGQVKTNSSDRNQGKFYILF